MSSKMVLWVVIVTLLTLSGFQIYSLVIRQPLLSNSGVLAVTTSMTVEQRLSSLESRVLILEKNAGLVKTNTTGKARELFVPLSGGTVKASDWTKIAGTDFSFNSSLYGGIVEVSWEGWVDNGNGSVRLYDDTNHRAVDNSELSVNSGSKASFYSKSLSIWRGQNQYHIEGKNPLGDLVVSQPRLRVVTK